MSPNARKAYRQYLEKHDLKPTLCTYPTLYFIDKDGKTISKNITAVYQDLGWSLNPSTGKWTPPKKKKEKAGA